MALGWKIANWVKLSLAPPTVGYLCIKTGTFGQPELFDPKLTRHFLQYAQNTHRPTHMHSGGESNFRVKILNLIFEIITRG